MRSIGAQRREVMSMFLSEAAILGSAGRVIGGLLSSTRLRYLVSHAFGVSPREVTGLVIGPHRRTMVFLRDTIRISGVPAAKLMDAARLDGLLEEARAAGDTILTLKPEGDRVGLDIGPYEWLEVEARL